MGLSEHRRGNPLDLKGRRFGRLKVIRLDEKRSKATPVGARVRYWACRCECGNEVSVRGKLLRDGKTRSCGCLHKEVAARSLPRPAKVREAFRDKEAIPPDEINTGGKTLYSVAMFARYLDVADGTVYGWMGLGRNGPKGCPYRGGAILPSWPRPGAGGKEYRYLDKGDADRIIAARAAGGLPPDRMTLDQAAARLGFSSASSVKRYGAALDLRNGTVLVGYRTEPGAKRRRSGGRGTAVTWRHRARYSVSRVEVEKLRHELRGEAGPTDSGQATPPPTPAPRRQPAAETTPQRSKGGRKRDPETGERYYYYYDLYAAVRRGDLKMAQAMLRAKERYGKKAPKDESHLRRAAQLHAERHGCRWPPSER
jgi:hypothetical protein